jgi:hypothetical protein
MVAGRRLEARAQDAEPRLDVTRRLARFLVSARAGDLPEAVRKEARRTVLNYVGCAVGGSRHETVDIAVAALAPFFGPAQSTLLGRRERPDAMHAALLNGISSHVFDFDDTHLKTVIHPSPTSQAHRTDGGAPRGIARADALRGKRISWPIPRRS